MWKVELAKTNDADGIARLYHSVWIKYRGILSEPLLKNRMPDKDKIINWMDSKKYFIVRDKDKMIGVVRCSIEDGTCKLDRMAVDENYKKKGIGTALTTRVIKYAKEENVSKVWLDTSPKLTEAESLYRKMGFKECGFFERHYWGEDIMFFELFLDQRF